jgi:hypothetical protein
MKTRLLLGIGVLFLALLMLSSFALAQSGYQLVASVVAGGGDTLQNGHYSLTGTLGQPEASQPFSSGAYALTGGFWHAGSQPKDLFLPLVIH